ncbi:hypothetical protein BSKO_04502 [Bryopsis sp. KO-2023]|nr:hypothetical protein BSKO_04502 [Bryopsis sp. KO-2023]
MDPIKNILIVIAMEAEAAPIIEALGLKKDDPSRINGPAPCEAFSGTFAGVSVTIVHNGKDPSHGVDNVGTVPAALTAYIAIQAYKPDLLISAGTAGGFKAKGGEIGDVYVSTACVNHDRRIPLPGFDEYGLGIKQSASTENLQAELPVKNGVVSSGNSLDYTDKCLEIMKENFAAVKEMEAAGIAWVADICKVPMFCVKAITDIVDGGRPSQEEFMENLSSAAQSLKSMLPKVLEFVANKKLMEL